MRILHAALLALAIAPELEAQQRFEPTSSGLFLLGPTDRYEQATTLATGFAIEVTGIVARVTVSQRFRNESADWVEGVYVFPLPDDAAVDELTMIVGDRRIAGEIRERDEARRVYEQARDAGQQASLIEQERPNVFTTSVANVAPNQEIEIRIGFSQIVAYDDGRFSLRLPTTLTPRFVVPSVTDAARITPPTRANGGAQTNRARFSITVDAGLPLAEIASASHMLATAYDGRRYVLSTADEGVPMNRDFRLDWRPVPDSSARLVVFTETARGRTHAIMMLVPPAAATLPEPTPREAVFVIDTSGSMGGQSIVEARAALAVGLDQLGTNDRFNVIEFDSDARALFPAPVPATGDYLLQARRFVSGLEANGGTNIAAALDAALAQPAAGGLLRQIVFVTDGSVGNEAELFAKIRRELGDARIFTVGIGSAPNTHFMRKSAEFGRGSFSHIARPDEVEPAMRRLFDKLRHVALTDIAMRWPGAREVYPERVPDLYRGEPVVVAARLDEPAATPFTVEASGMAAQYPWTERVAVTVAQSTGVAALWARRKIESLLDRRLEGEAEDAIRLAVLDVALEYGLLSPYTSLVAVDRTPERSLAAALRREAVGQLPPAGSEARLALLPATATDARWYQLIGTVLAALAFGLVAIWRITRQSDR